MMTCGYRSRQGRWCPMWWPCRWSRKSFLLFGSLSVDSKRRPTKRMRCKNSVESREILYYVELYVYNVCGTDIHKPGRQRRCSSASHIYLLAVFFVCLFVCFLPYPVICWKTVLVLRPEQQVLLVPRSNVEVGWGAPCHALLPSCGIRGQL